MRVSACPACMAPRVTLNFLAILPRDRPDLRKRLIRRSSSFLGRPTGFEWHRLHLMELVYTNCIIITCNIYTSNARGNAGLRTGRAGHCRARGGPGGGRRARGTCPRIFFLNLWVSLGALSMGIGQLAREGGRGWGVPRP